MTISLPRTYTDQNETGCCAIPNIEAWDHQIIEFRDKRFIRFYTKSFLYMPLNMEKVMTEIQRAAEEAGATMPNQEAMVLSRDISPWAAEQLYAVSQPVPWVENVLLNGRYATKVFEGPYNEAKQWMEEMVEYAELLGTHPTEVYFFYTTCPKCAKHYGKNYTIGFAKLG
jgi:hypothetical protein